jgi:acetyl esterase/lipase
VDAAGVSAEWVVANGTNPDWRMLYIHGGAFCSGSPLSHRTLTNRLSEVTGCAVLAIDYRLFPEHRLMAAILDCRTAYDWLLAHSCEGNLAPAQRLYVAGDSAGGNLTLSLLQWLRDSGRRLPDAAVALSPITDAGLLSASIQYNYKSDPVLRPLFSLLKRIPWPLYWFMTLLATRMSTSNPLLSPLLGRLEGLPPTLVQVSDSEMLLDDGRRYVNKATVAGSLASLQCWEGMPHVWQIFHPTLPSATRALDEIGRFCAQYPGSSRGAPD